MTRDLPPFLQHLLAAPPRAGEGVHAWLFRAARQLHAHLPATEIVALLESSVSNCGRHVSRSEIEDAVKNSIACAWQPNQNTSQKFAVAKWPEPNLEQIEAICAEGYGLADLWEHSNPRIEDSEQHTEEIIDRLFPPDALLCCGKSKSVFETRPREKWRGELSKLALIVPSPMIALTGLTKDGKKSAHALSNTGPRRFLIAECDFSIYARDGKSETKFAPLIRKLNREGFSVADMGAAVLLRLAELKAPSPDDGRELIRDRFLSRAGSVLFVGPTGAGKSSFAMQAGILWSIGKPCFGLRPFAPLRVLYIQAENDSGDLYEIRNGIYEGLEILPSDGRTAGNNIRIATVNDAVANDFLVSVLRPLLAEHKPDLLILDPLLAYLGGDVTRQDVVSFFVRSGLQPAIAEADCGLFLVHHPPKPRKDIGETKAGDDAYFGAGSADLANWARAVVVLKPTTYHGMYDLRLAKRGHRAGWVEADGRTPSFERTIAHGKGGLIYWRETDPNEIFTASPANTGKAELLALVPLDTPLAKDVLISRASAKNIGNNRARGFIAELIAEGRLFEWRIPRPRTCPKIALAHNPQPETKVTP